MRSSALHTPGQEQFEKCPKPAPHVPSEVPRTRSPQQQVPRNTCPSRPNCPNGAESDRRTPSRLTTKGGFGAHRAHGVSYVPLRKGLSLLAEGTLGQKGHILSPLCADYLFSLTKIFLCEGYIGFLPFLPQRRAAGEARP